MLGRKTKVVLFASIILLTINQPSIAIKNIYCGGNVEKKENINVNYKKGQQYIWYLQALNKSLQLAEEEHHKELERERLKKIAEEQKNEELNKNNNQQNTNINEGGEEVNLICTFYTGSAEENGGHTNLTASGKTLSRGMIASNAHSFGTQIYTERFGLLTVEDRGSSSHIFQVDNNTFRIDIYVESEEEAEQLGIVKTTGRVVN